MPVSNKTKNKRYYLGHRAELLEKSRKKIDENRKISYKERWTTHRANDNFGDGEHPSPREKMMKWIEEINKKEENRTADKLTSL